MQDGGEMRVVEVERVGRGAENHRTRVDVAGAENVGDRRHRGMTQAAGDAAEDVEKRAFRLASHRLRHLYCGGDEARELGGYSALMPACFTTGAHLAISARMKDAKASGVPSIGSAPCACRRSTISGEASALPTAPFSLSITGRGVPAGAGIPYQSDTAICGWPSSANVGASGTRRLRSGLAAASTRSLPLLTCWMSDGAASNMICTRPPIRSATAGPLPL